MYSIYWPVVVVAYCNRVNNVFNSSSTPYVVMRKVSWLVVPYNISFTICLSPYGTIASAKGNVANGTLLTYLVSVYYAPLIYGIFHPYMLQ